MSGDRVQARRRIGSPPGEAFFVEAGRAAPLGTGAARIELPGLTIGFSGMSDAWHQAFLARYGPYARDGAASGGGLKLSYQAVGRDLAHFIEPPPAGVIEYNPVFVEVTPRPGGLARWSARACTYEIAASFDCAGGAGRVVFSRGTFDPRERSVENIVRVSAAWLAISHGGALMHSASIVRDARAYLFFGQSGAGKSTLSASSRRGQVVSDDLTLMLPGRSGLEVVGAPFRGTYEGGDPVHGRFPVAAAFRLRKAAPGEGAAVLPLKRSIAMAEAIANLPFVVDQLHAGEELFEAAETLFGPIPIHALRFRKGDDSWWDAIEGMDP
ncbi:MAG TPA: hypothetical protein VFP98_10005 [Candidatus Polarisedimenticolia bacterium]|nr:hypothetical protein [Candidatus Polarisedimenticolia bacterium]